MNTIIKILIFTIITLFPLSKVLAQQSRTDYIVNKKMKLALAYMQDSNYNAANNAFRNILKTEKILPKNFSYYFSETLYHLGQFENSQNFLNKYFVLTGTKGDFYNQAVHLEKLLESEFNKINNCERCDRKGYLLTTCTVCIGNKTLLVDCHKCKSMGIISCQKCKGEGVVISTNNFGEKAYKTCDRCESNGNHKCDLCQGNKQIQSPCRRCLGSGKESTEILCTHDLN